MESVWLKRDIKDGVNLCYVNKKLISSIEFDDDYVIVYMLNNDVLYGYYDILMTLIPLGLSENMDVISYMKGFQEINPYFDMELFQNGETSFSLSPEEKNKIIEDFSPTKMSDYVDGDYAPF